MLRQIDRIILRVPGLEGAVRYYRDVLGLALIKQDARIANFRLADGETELVLHDDPDLPAEAVYYLVDSVRDLYDRRAQLKLKFVSPPSPVARGYRATVKDPFGIVMLLLDRSTQAAGGQAVEDAKPPGALFGGMEQRSPVKRDALIKAYLHIARTADDLPYTPHFESLYSTYAAAHGEIQPTRAEVWRHLLNLRKGGKLPKLGEARSRPPDVTPEDRDRLKQMLGEDIGRRDRLPYTDRFNQLVDEFNTTQTRPLSPHLVWRLVATLAK
ncbi:MAG TPA: VOC family protein [Tepidisphaeraceae bacterium]|nr:VOC family protein [Tepidisphaeraceae bacterium]